MRDAYVMGADAYRNGDGAMKNPFGISDPRRIEWVNGYLAERDFDKIIGNARIRKIAAISLCAGLLVGSVAATIIYT